MTSRRQGGSCFAAIPFRAIVHLDGLRLKLLGVIAAHDRMGTGQGCWAESTRLAQLVDTDPSVVRRYVSTLVTDGYIRRERRITDRRKWVLRVNYDNDADWAAFAAKSVTSRSHRSPENSVTKAPEICNQESAATRQNTSIPAPNIDSESGSYSESRCQTLPTEEEIAETAPPSPVYPEPQSFQDGVNLINSDQPASHKNPNADDVEILGVRYRHIGEYLRKAEQFVKSAPGRTFDETELDSIREHRNELEALALAYDLGDPIGGKAGRLCGEFHSILEQADFDDE